MRRLTKSSVVFDDPVGVLLEWLWPGAMMIPGLYRGRGSAQIGFCSSEHVLSRPIVEANQDW